MASLFLYLLEVLFAQLTFFALDGPFAD